MRALKNRHKITLLTTLLVFCVLLSSPTIASISQSVSQDIGPSPTVKTWISADLPEGAVILNNLEDFIDQLSDLHNESDIGTHSNPTTLQVLDGVYDILTSDNITIPEQTIYDPENGTPLYNQSAYESWQLDLEGGWTDVDYDEISAELCIYGGIQAEEALRVDIWDNEGWINVIADVQSGWNNISIAPSLVDKSLEARFTGSNSGNTSIQSSWEIDAVLLHTWTTVYGSELTQHGIIQDLGNNLSRYIASVGEHNTWDKVNETWHRYLYDPDAKVVQIGNLTISHLPDGTLSIDGDAGTRVGKLSWYIQAYYADQWNNITLDNYQFIGFTKTPDNITAHQRFWGTQGEMNVYLTYSYFGGFKTRVDIRNDAAQAVPIRAIWAARNVSGLQDNYNLLRNEDDIVYGIQIEDAVFSWGDVIASDNPLPTQTVIDKPNRRAAVVFGDQSTVIPSGYTTTIDPDYIMTSDAYDNYWDYWEDPADTDVDNADANKIETDGSSHTYAALFAVPVTIEPYSIVTAATLTVYVISESGANTVHIQRIDSANVGTLDNNINSDGGSPPTIDTSLTGTLLIGATSWITSQDIGKLVQNSINEAGWASGNRMGFRLMPDAVCAHTIEDYQKATSNHAKITITYVAPSENWLSDYTYRQAHSVDGSTGADTDYQIKVTVEYGSGTSADGTIYCNEHSQTDFDDIRFTDNDGQTELDYWMEEKTDSDDATFWVEVTDDLGSDQVVYCYYGKSGDSTTSSGANTFLLFDNFNDDSINTTIWGTETGSPAETGGHLVLTGGTERVYSNTEFTTSVAMVARSYFDDMRTMGFCADSGGVIDQLHSAFWDHVSIYDDGRTYVREDGNLENDLYSMSDNTWYNLGINWYSTTHVEFFVDGTERGDTVDPNVICSKVTYPQRVWFYVYGPDSENLQVDWVFVRKLTSGAEPAHYTWGTEQEPPNTPPTNDGTPTIATLDDTDKMYSRYRKYEITTYLEDLDGYADIDLTEFSVYGDDRVTRYFYGRFVQSTHVFSEQGTTDQKNRWELDTAGSTYSENANALNVTWKFYVEWVATDLIDMDVRSSIWDTEAVTTDYYETTWDIETDLEYDTSPTVTSDDAGTVDRGDLDETFHITGDVSYQSSALTPPSGDVDVWVAMTAGGYGSNVGPWEDDTVDAGGAFDVTCYADNEVGIETYTIKVVDEGTGYGGTDLIGGADPTNTYIADRIQVQSYSVSNARGNINDNVNIDATLIYDYNDAELLDGTVTINGYSAAHQGSGVWRITRTSASVTSVTYDTVVASGNEHGINDAVDQNGQSQEVIWDRIKILTTTADDAHISYDTQATIAVTAELEYDHHALGSGDTLYMNNTAMSWNGSHFILNPQFAAVDIWNFFVNSTNANEATHAITVVNLDGNSVNQIWDRVNLTLTSNLSWTIIDYNTTLSATGVFEYDSTSWSGVVTWTDRFPSESTVNTYNYGASSITSITDPTHDVTVFAVGEEAAVIFDDVVPSGSVDYYWTTPTSPNLDSVNLIWGAGSNWKWDYNDTLLNVAVIFTSYSNGSAPSGSGGTYGSGAFGGLTTGLYNGIVWNYVEFNVNATVTIGGVDYDWEIWGAGLTVVVPHSLTTSVWFFYKDGDYYQLLMHTNYENASVMVWDDMEVGDGYDDSIYYGDYEGMHEWLRDTTVGTHNCTILLNAGADKGAVARNYVANDLRLWYNFTYAVAEPLAYDCHIVILDSLYNLIPFDTFEVYKNGTRIYHDIIRVTDGYGYQIEVKNRYGDTVNSTAFSADREMVIFVNVYSLKFWSAYEGFCVLTISRGGVDYSEVLMPMEIVNFRLYSENYTYSIDYLDDTIMSGEINLLSSTGVVITNDTISDIFGLIDSLWDLTDQINVTITATNNYVLTISIDLENINSTIGYQLVQVLLNITNTNTTIYSQVVDLLAYLQNVNSTLFDQTVDIVIELNYISSNVTAGFISVAATLSAIDSNLYSNFTSVAATLVMLDSSLLSNFTEVSAVLLAIDSSLLSNFTYVMANLTAIGTNITTNYLSVSAALSAIDSSLLSNFTSIAAYLTLIDSNMLSNFTEVTATLTAIGSNVTSNYLSVAAALTLIDSNLFNNFTSITTTLSAIGSNITTNYLAVAATLSLIDSSLLSNFTVVSATLLSIDSSLLSNFTSVTADLALINSTLVSNFTSVVATLSSIGSNITSNYLSVAATLSMIDSSLLSNFTSITATLSMIDSALLSNFTELTAELLLVNSSIATQFLSVSATLSMLDSSLLSNFTSVTATLSAIGTNITSNYLSVVATLTLIDSQLASNFTYVVSQLLSVNSSITSQFITIISNVAELNATIFLVDDPTHLNPLVLGYSLSDDYCDLTIVTNWHNASISVYDNDELRSGPTSELLCPIRYPLLVTSGTHNLSIFVDGGNDSFWYNISYTVAEIIAFEIENWDVTPHLGVENYLECIFRTTWGNSTIYVYLNDSLQTSVLEQEGGISFSFWMSGNPGLHQYMFNVTSGTNVITITWDFYLPDWADTGLVVRWDLWTFQNNYTLITLESNWMNCTYYVYLNSSLVATSYNDPVTLNFTRSLNNGTYNLTIYADGGTQTYTISNIRYIVTEEGVSYDFSSFTGGLTIVEGDTYEGDVVTINENPTGVFIDQATAAIIAVGSFLIIFTAFLVARELKQREREKTERTYSQ